MKILYINNLEIHLKEDQAFLYTETESDVLNIEGIEFCEEPERLILEELHLKSRSSLMDQLDSFFL